MKRALAAIAVLALFAAAPVSDASYLTATFQRVAPLQPLIFFGRPSDASVNPSTTTIAVKTSHGVVFVNPRTLTIAQTLHLPKLHLDFPVHLGGNAPAGIIWSADGSEVWDTDAYTTLHVARKGRDGRFAWTATVPLPNPDAAIVARTDVNAGNTIGAAPIGLLRGSGSDIWVTLSRNNAIAVVDARKLRVVHVIPVGVAPYGISSARGKLYVSNWGGAIAARGDARADSSGTFVRIDPRTGVADSGTVSVVNERTLREEKQITVGLHPNAIVASHDGRSIYVANASSDTISAIDTATGTVVRTLALDDRNEPTGAMPDALAVSDDDRTLYVAEGGENRVLAIDLPSGVPRAQFDTGWYPSALALIRDRLYVASLKGVGSRAKDFGLQLVVALHRKGGYNVYDYAGTFQAAVPSQWSAVKPDQQPQLSGTSILPRIFKRAILVIKENHTYDDIYGDVTAANGDRRLCLFCQPVTPNQHALAARFGVFDNSFVNGTLSADGHNWMDSAYASDYMERSIAGWARSYPSAGGDALAYSPAGFIWNLVLSAGLEFRDYGEFIPDVRTFSYNGKRRTVSWSEVYSDYVAHTHKVTWEQRVDIKSLRPYVDMDYPSFTLRIPDQYRASMFIADFHHYEGMGRLPSLSIIALPNDHTAYTSPGFPKPESAAADNDLALGRIVSTVSHSRFWNDTVIFVIEDDAQDGTDHVDGHRTAALVISAHNKPKLIDHHFYNQASILRTIELILGLPPMTVFDRIAPPIVYPFHVAADTEPYDAIPNRIPLDAINPPAVSLSGMKRRYAIESEKMFADREDVEEPALARQILKRLPL